MTVCVHMHCYQPPREDPATGRVPVEESAAPFHDWNHRITDECYRPLGNARVFAADGTIDRAVNLYAHLSFNVAPTLALWLDRFAPDVMAAMTTGDRQARASHDGAGTAVAQSFVHAILPLAPRRDRETMIRWGMADFRHRFGREAQGMWMPETAVDTPTLESLAACGIRFTIVAPYQLAALSEEAHIDPQMPCEITLPSGRTITVFGYGGGVAHEVAFGDLLADGKRFAQALAHIGDDDHGIDVLRSLAVDAETFGHHKKFGEMALAYAITHFEEEGHAVLSYEQWLANDPRRQPAHIVEETSWSCAHGIERWRSDCGCNGGRGVPTGQAWRTPLRDGITDLITAAAELTDTRAGSVLRDPWAARDEWVNVLIGAESEESFVSRHAVPGAGVPDVVTWMRAHHHLLLAQSSCAWFFDAHDGHETLISIHQADRAIELFRQLTGVNLDERWQYFMRAMEPARDAAQQ